LSVPGESSMVGAPFRVCRAFAPMSIDKAVNIEDLHRLAKRRLPKIAFDFIEGGLEDERGLGRNTSAFYKRLLLPRYFVDVSTRDQTQTLFGHTYASRSALRPPAAPGCFAAAPT
jgi:(S)-mandelate dehydrogenase